MAKEVDAWEGLQTRACRARQMDPVHTSSRDIACLKTRIAVFTVTKGKDLDKIIPTLATVSLLIGLIRLGGLRIFCEQLGQEHSPDTKKVDFHRAAEGRFISLSDGIILRGLEKFVCKRYLLDVVLRE